MNRFPIALPALVALCLLSACGGGSGANDPDAPAQRPGPVAVSGRQSTQAGVSFDFSSGWQKVTVTGPYTTEYRHRDKELHLGVADFQAPAGGFDQMVSEMERYMTNASTVLDKGFVKVDGVDVFRILVERDASGTKSVAAGMALVRPSRRATTVFVTSTGDSIAGRREAIEQILGTMRVEE